MMEHSGVTTALFSIFVRAGQVQGHGTQHPEWKTKEPFQTLERRCKINSRWRRKNTWTAAVGDTHGIPESQFKSIVKD
jgi:hypothetical protein